MPLFAIGRETPPAAPAGTEADLIEAAFSAPELGMAALAIEEVAIFDAGVVDLALLLILGFLL